MNLQGLDRRILRAFYTQYVSLLLILLVFFVTAFQTKSDTHTQKEIANPEVRTSPLGGMQIAHPFESNGSLKKENVDLEALANVLRSHDVRADLVLTVPLLDFEGREPSLVYAARQTDALAEFFMRREIPVNAYRFIIRQKPGAPSEDISVQLIPEEGHHAVR